MYRPRIMRLDETGRSQKERANSKQRCWRGPSHGGRRLRSLRQPGRGSLSCCWVFSLFAMTRGQIDVAVCGIAHNMPGDLSLGFNSFGEPTTVCT